MRALILAAVVAAITACATERVELFPNQLFDGGADAAPVVADLANGGTITDLGRDDLSSSCVCRLVSCRSTSDCQTAIGPTSSCDATFACTGGGRGCSAAVDCASDPTGWLCAASATSTDTCSH